MIALYTLNGWIAWHEKQLFFQKLKKGDPIIPGNVTFHFQTSWKTPYKYTKLLDLNIKKSFKTPFFSKTVTNMFL